jgi:signal transduction histidine kinase
MKFSKTGGSVELGGKILTEKRDDKLLKFIEIYVEDNGYGIGKNDKNKLFKLFGKLKQKDDVNKNGIGLGLNICKQICELFGGDIDVDSELGIGSRFFFKFMLSEKPYLGEVIEESERLMLEKSADLNDMNFELNDEEDQKPKNKEDT